MNDSGQISRGRMVLGGSILVLGFMSPLLIPLVTRSGLSIGIKSTLAGLLAFGIPEVFMLVAIAILGKKGYEFMKGKVLLYFKRIAPLDSVSLSRYRLGLAMFTLPFLFGWLQPYLAYYFSVFNQRLVWPYIVGDIIFVASFFVLGGDFWDKFSGLFKHGVKVERKNISKF